MTLQLKEFIIRIRTAVVLASFSFIGVIVLFFEFQYNSCAIECLKISSIQNIKAAIIINFTFHVVTSVQYTQYVTRLNWLLFIKQLFGSVTLREGVACPREKIPLTVLVWRRTNVGLNWSHGDCLVFSRQRMV